MPKRLIGIVIVILGLLLLLTPWYIFPVCGKGRHAPGPGMVDKPHRCANSLYAETALGILTVGIGALALARPRRKILSATSASLLVVAALVSLFPLWITGMCKVATMPCRIGTLPGLILIAVLLAITSVAGMVQARNLK